MGKFFNRTMEGLDPKTEYDLANIYADQQEVKSLISGYEQTLRSGPDERRTRALQKFVEQSQSNPAAQRLKLNSNAGAKLSKNEAMYLSVVKQAQDQLARQSKAREGLEKAKMADSLLRLKAISTMDAARKRKEKEEKARAGERMTYLSGEIDRREKEIRDKGIDPDVWPEKYEEAKRNSGINDLERRYAVEKRKKRAALFPSTPDPKAAVIRHAGKTAGKIAWEGSKALSRNVKGKPDESSTQKPRGTQAKSQGIPDEAVHIMRGRGIPEDQMQQYWDEYQAARR